MKYLYSELLELKEMLSTGLGSLGWNYTPRGAPQWLYTGVSLIQSKFRVKPLDGILKK